MGTEQLLLGMIGEGTGIAAKVLKSQGVNLKEARVEVEKIIGRGSGFVAVEIPFTPRAKRVLELSLEEARHLGHHYIGTEHLLLGLLREGEGVAARVLENLGADAAKIRTQVIKMVGEEKEAVGVGSGPRQAATRPRRWRSTARTSRSRPRRGSWTPSWAATRRPSGSRRSWGGGRRTTRASSGSRGWGRRRLPRAWPR